MDGNDGSSTTGRAKARTLRRLKRALGMLGQTLSEAWEDRISRMAASLAFYATFSFGPMLLIAIKVGSVLVGARTADESLRSGLAAWVGAQPAKAIESMVHEAALLQSGGGWVTILGVVALAWAIVSLFIELHDSMDTIWGVQLRPGQGWRAAVRHWLLSFVVMLATGAAIVASLVINAALASSGGALAMRRAVGSVSSFVIFSTLFAALYKWLPDVRVPWRDVWMGAAVTSGLLVLGEYLVGLYMARPRIVSVYGAIGSLALLLLWVYYSAHALFLGVEFTQVYARRSGEKIQPDEEARWMTAEERAKRSRASSERAFHHKSRRGGNGSN